ncbi:MAG: 30S ribosome-binding factor RbfA [Clostridia bacterium]|nr:30S ribosome-binding factor RbfA [Clostridia bacterium]
MASSRNRKIAEEIKKIVSHLMLVEIKDPRISKLSSVNHVEVTNDLRYTTLYISCFDPKHNVEMTIEGLNSAKGFIRKEIGKRLKLHFTPEPIFKADHSVEHGMHINEILGTLNIKSDEEPDQELVEEEEEEEDEDDEDDEEE